MRMSTLVLMSDCDRFTTAHQGLTLFHFSAQRKRFRWHRGRIQMLFRVCLGGVQGVTKGCQGVFRGCLGGA